MARGGTPLMTIFGEECAVLAELGQGFALVACSGKVAIGRGDGHAEGALLSHPHYDSEAVPALVRRRALSEMAKRAARGAGVEAGV